MASQDSQLSGFPVDHYSTSMWAQFSTNPFLFKVKYLNREQFETTQSVAGVLGKAAHVAIQTLLGANKDVPVPIDMAEAYLIAKATGEQYLNNFSDGCIRYNDKIDCRAKLVERYSFAFNEAFKTVSALVAHREVLLVEESLKYRIAVTGKDLPVPIQSIPDLVLGGDDIDIHDHKFVSQFSNREKIDARKLIQAAFNYFTVYAKAGRAPRSFTFDEYKYVPNKGAGELQHQPYQIVYKDNPLIFALFYRLYEDITDALLGHQVYVPNFDSFYDNEVAIIAYIHRLDVDEVRAAEMKKHRVDSVTDLLKRKIAKTRDLQKFADMIGAKFSTATKLNYENMTTQERIQTKLMEHGIGLEFHSMVVGPTVTRYRYEPSIGVKMTRIEAFTKDIELVTASTGVRILAPIAGTDLIGFEVPNKERTFVGTAPHAQNLRVAVGVDIQGQTQYVNVPEAPHVLVAGTTGSGKSVLVNSMLAAIGGTAELWLMDPKQVELSGIACERYADTTEDIHAALKDLVEVMEERFGMMKGKEKTWSGRRIVAVIDELADLMMTSRERAKADKAKASVKRAARREASKVIARESAKQGMTVISTGASEDLVEEMSAEDLLMRLAQKGRAAGIHLIVATQTPRKDVITGSIKANFPTRIALRTASPIDSEVILGAKGAEKLCGKGDLLLQRSDSSELVRLQGFSA